LIDDKANKTYRTMVCDVCLSAAPVVAYGKRYKQWIISTNKKLYMKRFLITLLFAA